MGTTTQHDSAAAATVDDGDLVVTSSTDSAEDIAAGLATVLRGEAEPEDASDADVADDDAADETAAETTEEPADAEDDEEPPAPAKDDRSERQKELDRIAKASRKDAERKHADTKAELERAQQRIRDLETKGNDERFKPRTVQPHEVPATEDAALAKVLKQRTDLGAKPDQAAFDDYDAFEKKRDEWLEQSGALKREEELIRRQVADRLNEQSAASAKSARELVEGHEGRVAAYRTAHPTYDKDLEVLGDLRPAPLLQQALMEAEDGPAIIHYLAKNPEEAKKLVALSPMSGVTAIGRISATLAAKSQSRTTPSTGNPNPPRFSKAPRPQGSVLGSGKGANTQVDLDDPNLSQEDYNKRRDEMDRQKGRRR